MKTLLITIALIMMQPSSQVSEMGKTLQKMGYVNVQDADKDIQVSLMYCRKDNFTGKILYTSLQEAYLHPTAADALARASKRLKKINPKLSLRVYDAARPMEVQQQMWNVVKNTPLSIYVSNPANGGGLHNYGLAVDITIADEHGDTIPMGTKIDHMSYRSHIDCEQELVKRKQITAEAQRNRQLLRQVMAAGGFTCLRTEWWHFNLCSRKEAKAKYKVIRLQDAKRNK